MSSGKLDSLAALNSATLGTSVPAVTLPGGSKIQTGTIGALLVNIREYDRIMAGPGVDDSRKGKLEEKMAVSMPVLKKSGEYSICCYV